MFYDCGTDKSETLTFYWLLYSIEIMAGNTLIQVHHTHYNYTSEKFWQKLIRQSLRQIANNPILVYHQIFSMRHIVAIKGKLQHLTWSSVPSFMSFLSSASIFWSVSFFPSSFDSAGSLHSLSSFPSLALLASSLSSPFFEFICFLHSESIVFHVLIPFSLNQATIGFSGGSAESSEESVGRPLIFSHSCNYII